MIENRPLYERFSTKIVVRRSLFIILPPIKQPTVVYCTLQYLTTLMTHDQDLTTSLLCMLHTGTLIEY